MKELLIKNIYALIPIILLSIISLSLIINKFLYFFYIRIKNQNKIDKALDNLLHCNYHMAIEDIKNEYSPAADIIRNEGKLLGQGNATVYSHKVEAYCQRKIYEMEKHVALLSSIANISTLLGLLGTVVGMIFTFYNMMISKSSDPYTLAGGISQALITTAAGLITAVPAILFYSVFISIIKKHISSMESLSSEILAAKES